MRTITAIVITAILLLTSAGQYGTTLTDNSVATVQEPVLSGPVIDSPTPVVPEPVQPELTDPITPVETVAQTRITREEALQIAYAHAGITADKIYDLEAELDWEQGVQVWEVDFESAGTEYEYDIEAATGKILKSRIEPPKQTKPAQQTTTTTQTTQKLTREQAKQIALNHAGVSTVYDLDVELEKEKGAWIYEVDFEVGNTEYEYKIDAYSGKILHTHKELDD